MHVGEDEPLAPAPGREQAYHALAEEAPRAGDGDSHMLRSTELGMRGGHAAAAFAYQLRSGRAAFGLRGGAPLAEALCTIGSRCVLVNFLSRVLGRYAAAGRSP
jgi:hypothetical protein